MNDSARRKQALRLDETIDRLVEELTSVPNDPYFAARVVATLDEPRRALRRRRWLAPSVAVVAVALLVVAGITWRREGIAPAGVDAGPPAAKRAETLVQPMAAARMAAIEPTLPAGWSTAGRAAGRTARTTATAGVTAGGASMIELGGDTSGAGDESAGSGAVTIGQLDALDPVAVNSLEFPTVDLDTVRVEPVAILLLDSDWGRPGIDGARRH